MKFTKIENIQLKGKELLCRTRSEIFKDSKGEFRFRFKVPNGKDMFASEGYKTKTSAMKTIESIKKNTPGSDVDDQT